MTRCPVCGGEARGPAETGLAPVRRARHFDASRVGSARRDVETPELQICRACGLAWQRDMPGTEALEAAYESMRDDAYVDEAYHRIRTLERGIRLLHRYAGREPAALLDVGCSAGLFLEVALRHGWDAWGVEPSRWLSDRARQRVGERVLTATLERAPLEGRRFDAVTMWDVLEHVRDPQSFIGAARRLLRPSGLLIVNVPARDTLIAAGLGQRWPLLLPEHLFYFSRDALRHLLEHCGFRLLGFHGHVVFFSLGYVLRRLDQHAWPGVGALARVLGGSRLCVPLLMGEVTVVARACS